MVPQNLNVSSRSVYNEIANFHTMLQRLIKSNSLLLIREAFTSLLPIVLVLNILALISSLPTLLESSGLIAATTTSTNNELYQLHILLLPLFFNVSLSILLAKEKDLDQISTLLISMVCFFRASEYLSIGLANQIILNKTSTLIAIVIPFFVISLLNYLSKIPIFNILENHLDVSPRLTKTINFLIPGLLTLFVCEIIHQLIQRLGSDFLRSLTDGLHAFTHEVLNQSHELFVFTIIAQISWFFGIHGIHAAEGLLTFLKHTHQTELTGVHLKTFHDVFMNIGGSGSTFVIPFILLFSKQARSFKSIGRISLPFAFFNVNEILLFGLPIIFNPILFVPFFTVPLANMVLALLAIQLKLFEVDPTYIHWMSPPFYNAFVTTHGSIWAVLTQILCICVDGLIYLPFLVLSKRKITMPKYVHSLLGDDAFQFVKEEINVSEERIFVGEKLGNINKMNSAQKILRQLRGGHFLIYFQPKVDAISKELVGLEALLRLQNLAGEVLPPTFLPILCEQGLSKVIDTKVVNLVFEQVLRWRSQGLNVPPISINFDKDFLLDKQAVQAFIQRSKENNIRFFIEITEHTFTVEVASLASIIEQLRAAGHWISIDDFGAGYSSLTSLLNFKADEIKLDRHLVVAPQGEEERGRVLLASSVRLCKELGFTVVAEGIESLQQLYLVQTCGVDTVQGYLTGHPMSAEKVSLLFDKKRPQ